METRSGGDGYPIRARRALGGGKSGARGVRGGRRGEKKGGGRNEKKGGVGIKKGGWRCDTHEGGGEKWGPDSEKSGAWGAGTVSTAPFGKP